MLVTTCPECETTFRISVGILEKAGGQVRCGRCAKIFDANVDLREIDDADAVPGTDPEIQVDLEAEAELPADGGYAADEETESESNAETGAQEATADDDANADPDAKASDLDDEADAATTPDADSSAGTDATAEKPALPDWLRPISRPELRRTWPWAVGAAVLGVTLAVQLIHRFRNELVSVPVAGSVLERVYSFAGIELVAPVDLDQFELLDLTALAEPAGEEQGWLIIETRVQNKGPKIQPYPTIFVRLLDRWEDTVAGRYFAPNEYTVSAISDSSRMNIGTTIDAQFIIMDPGPSATGFELELCTEIAQGFLCESDTNFQ